MPPPPAVFVPELFVFNSVCTEKPKLSRLFALKARNTRAGTQTRAGAQPYNAPEVDATAEVQQTRLG